jgi:hypothetical protein
MRQELEVELQNRIDNVWSGLRARSK